MMKQKLIRGLGVMGLVLYLFGNEYVLSYADWHQTDHGGWWYETDDSNGYYTGWNNINGQWYYFDPSGYMVGSDGAWIPDQSDLNDVLKDIAIYGELLFAPLHYEKQGDSWLVTGILCDSVYASREYLSSLQVGDMIKIPDETSGRVDFFKRVGRVSEVNQALGRVSIYDGIRDWGYTPYMRMVLEKDRFIGL